MLDELGGRGVLQLLVEGGATVAHAFHAAGLVDRYVVYLAPAVFGGDDAARPVPRVRRAPTIDALRRGRFTSVSPLGDDVRLDLVMERSAVADAGPVVHRVADARLPTEFGAFRCLAFQADGDDETHLALVLRRRRRCRATVLVRVHSECLTGDVFALPALRLRSPAARRHGADRRRRARGVVVYLCGHEGRGIGIAHKLRAYELQDQGFDTVDANLELGLPVDDRDYGIGAAILHDLGVGRIRAADEQPGQDRRASTAAGIDIAGRVPLVTDGTPTTTAYLRTKQERMGHRFEPD